MYTVGRDVVIEGFDYIFIKKNYIHYISLASSNIYILLLYDGNPSLIINGNPNLLYIMF